MTHNKKNQSKLVSLLLAGLCLGPFSSRAYAADQLATPDIVEYQSNRLLIQLPTGGGGYTNYLAVTAAPAGCAANLSNNIDTLKAWQSLAASALLAGKKLRIYYTLCVVDSVNYVWAVDLVRA